MTGPVQFVLLLADSSADPSIQEKQRQLKRCRLADSLNEKLAHRPGPLELVQENILHVDAALEQAVKGDACRRNRNEQTREEPL